jgi:L-2-hydroxyglutarate oxidase
MTENAPSTARIGVIGAGIVGLSVARRLLRARNVEVTVIDKEPTVAAHQTSHNSNVVHSGVYYPPGSLKATLCRHGVELLRAYCAEHQLPYEEVGKVIVAVREDELPQLFGLADRAKANGIAGSRVIDTSELREREPHVRGLSALLIPETAVVDYRLIAEELAAEIVQAGGEVILGHPVTEIDAASRTVRVATEAQERTFDHVVVCAGLQSSQLARMAGAPADPEIIPFRGEYYEIAPGRRAFHARPRRQCSRRTECGPSALAGGVSMERHTGWRRLAHSPLSGNAQNGPSALANGCSRSVRFSEFVNIPASCPCIRAGPGPD